MAFLLLLLLPFCLLLPAPVSAMNLERLLAKADLPDMSRFEIGLTRNETPVIALLGPEHLALETDKIRVLVIGGLDGELDSVKSVLSCLEWFSSADAAKPFHQRFTLSAVPSAYPDTLIQEQEKSDEPYDRPGYPPQGEAYGGVDRPEVAHLWRWIGMHAPDLLLELRQSEDTMWLIPRSTEIQWQQLAETLKPARHLNRGSTELVSQVGEIVPGGTGTIAALGLEVPLKGSQQQFGALLEALLQSGFQGPSPARQELKRRLNRSPLEIASQLAERYGHDLSQVMYIPAVALIGRLTLDRLTKNNQHLLDVERIVAPYMTGAQPSLPDPPSGSHLSGHLVFSELARLTGKQEYLEIARRAADLGFDNEGQPRSSMPFHSEMSDAVFMGCPILAQVGRLTKEKRFFDMCLRHMRFMLRLNLREDGLHRHSPLHQSAWGRGNAFPALGLALSLSDLPSDHSGREEMLEAFQAHIRALVKHQDSSGCWHQVIDVPGSYRELSCTCMITFSLLRGVRSGWLEKQHYLPVIEKACKAIRLRVAEDGSLVDVCTGTGKGKNRRYYLDRKAILGPDPRGGAMALLVATEMAMWMEEH